MFRCSFVKISDSKNQLQIVIAKPGAFDRGLYNLCMSD